MFTFDGLFHRCIKPNPMRFQCDQYQKSILGLPQNLQIMRAMCTLALTFGCISIYPALFALDRVTLPGLSRYTKTVMGILTAFLQCLSGKITSNISLKGNDRQSVPVPDFSRPTFECPYLSLIYPGTKFSCPMNSVFSGCLILAVLSTYSADITRDYNYNRYPNQRFIYTLGPNIYAAMFVVLSLWTTVSQNES